MEKITNLSLVYSMEFVIITPVITYLFQIFDYHRVFFFCILITNKQIYLLNNIKTSIRKHKSTILT